MQKTVEKHYRMDEHTVKLLAHNLRIVNETAKKNITESEYIRDLIRRDYQESIGINAAEFVEIRKILAGLGNNVNQIAHHFNAGLYDMYDIDNLKQCIHDISEIKQHVSEMANGE